MTPNLGEEIKICEAKLKIIKARAFQVDKLIEDLEQRWNSYDDKSPFFLGYQLATTSVEDAPESAKMPLPDPTVKELFPPIARVLDSGSKEDGTLDTVSRNSKASLKDVLARKGSLRRLANTLQPLKAPETKLQVKAADFEVVSCHQRIPESSIISSPTQNAKLRCLEEKNKTAFFSSQNPQNTVKTEDYYSPMSTSRPPCKQFNAMKSPGGRTVGSLNSLDHKSISRSTREELSRPAVRSRSAAKSLVTVVPPKSSSLAKPNMSLIKKLLRQANSLTREGKSSKEEGLDRSRVHRETFQRPILMSKARNCTISD